MVQPLRLHSLHHRAALDPPSLTLFLHHGSDLLLSALIYWGSVPSSSHTYTSDDCPQTPAN